MSPEQRLSRLLMCNLPEAVRETEELIVGREIPQSNSSVLIGTDEQGLIKIRPGEQAFAKFFGSVQGTISWSALGQQGTCTIGSLEQTEAQLTSILRVQKRLTGADALILNGGEALFKLPPKLTETAMTTVRDVIWKLNRHGHLEPTILVDSVVVCEQIVERVTGHNAKYIYDEGIGPLALVRIRRSGGVIPIVDAVLGRADAAMPCGTAWAWTADGLNAVNQ